ncbi:MAG: hypothetical protein GXP16_14060 [Gammaproteobacteria bacterium]|nr:hypothetical protein [Gammaproteobacteria bacterium]
METILATKWLVASGCFAIFLSSLLGVVMLIPLQKPRQPTGTGVNFKQIGAAHIDWIMLGLMSTAAGGLIYLFDLTLPFYVIGFMIFGAWINPLSYVWRAFGINAFQFAGGPRQRLASFLSGFSSVAIILAWGVIFYSLFGSLGLRL